MRPSFREVAEGCIECGLCREDCPFLQKHGLPRWIAESCLSSREAQHARAFECSLCGLCTALCPVRLDPMKMFLHMRREAFVRGQGEDSRHRTLLNYERRGVSPHFCGHFFPPGCDTVFFPGCALPGTRPGRVFQLLEHLHKSQPSLGIVLDCCTKPSHDLGRTGHFEALFGHLKKQLWMRGVRTVLVACPSCHKVFKEHGREFHLATVYERLSDHRPPVLPLGKECVTVHDPCAVRFERHVQEAVRFLIRGLGLTLEEMTHHGEKTLCCGEGGAAGFVAPGFSRHWKSMRKEEAKGFRMITYCAGCVDALESTGPISHLLDLLFEPQASLAGKVKVSRTPMTYWNRFRLRQKLKKRMPDALWFTRASRTEGLNG